MTGDELLARIDERSNNIYKLVEAQGRHLDAISVTLEGHNSSINLLNMSVYGKNGNEG